MNRRKRIYRWLPLVPYVVVAVCLMLAVSGVSTVPAAAQRIDLRQLREMTHVPSRDWESDIAAIERRYIDFDTSGGAIVFIGSSSIYRWASLADDFPGQPVINAGFGGSQIVDSIVYTDRLITPYAPHTVVLFAGSNDISAGKSPARVFDDYVAFVDGVHRQLPTTQIVFIAITPSESRWSQHPRVMEANALIQAYTATDDRLHFVNVYDAMLGDDGRPDAALYVEDRLHLSRAGYEVWIEALQPYFTYPFQPVWLEGPDNASPVQTPALFRVYVAPELTAQTVRLSLSEHVIYEGTAAPAGDLSTGHLDDGRYDVVLEVVDGNGTAWLRRSRLNVANALIVTPPYGAIVANDVTIVPASGFHVDELEHATVTLTPLRQGAPQAADAITLFEGRRLPETVHLDTLQLGDATYELRLSLTSRDGVFAQHSQPLIVRNWQQVHDNFLPPQSNSWFGAIDRKRTLVETPGWDYATDNMELFFGDDSRRIWTGSGEGELQWEAPRFHHMSATVYVTAGNTPELAISVSTDGFTWEPLAVQLIATQHTNDVWQQVEALAQNTGPAEARYVRLTVTEAMAPHVMQLGHVTIVSRAQ